MQEPILQILQKLDKIDRKIDRMEMRIDGMQNQINQVDQKIEDLSIEFKQENEKLKEELRAEFKQENRLIERMKQEVLAQMFVFESDYGRKINIMYEELMARNEKTEALEKSIIALERRVDKNSAFIFHYESQNATLEKTKH